MKLSWITFVRVLLCVGHAFGCLIKFEEEHFKLDPLTEPLYNGDSVQEFLGLCGGKDYKTSEVHLKKLREKALSKTEKGMDSECEIPNKEEPELHDKTLTNLQMYYLKNAQSRVQQQKKYFEQPWRGVIRWVLFLIPLSLTVFLVMAGHFDYKTLPLLGNSMFQSDSTDGIKYQQYQWMRYLILPGNHSVFKGTERNLEDPSWVKYNRKDTTFSWKSVTFGRFKFFDHKQISKNIEDDEAHAKRINIWKSGWDFGLQENQRHHHTQSRRTSPVAESENGVSK